MKDLYNFIEESMLTKTSTKVDQTNALLDNQIKSDIIHFIESYYYKKRDTTFKFTKKGDKFVVDVDGGLGFNEKFGKELTSLTNDYFVFGKVTGTFDCNYAENIESLEGAPKEVGGDFECILCKKLTTLEGAPKKVGGDFYCKECYIESLKGAPKEVGGDFYCGRCHNITSLKGAPKEVGGSFYCGECENLTSLKGAPKKVGGSFCCEKCNLLKTLEGGPEIVMSRFICARCKGLTSLKGAPKEINGPDSVNQVTVSLDCSWCSSLNSLEGCTPNLKAMSIEGCKSLKSLQGAPKVSQFFNAKYCGFSESDVTKEIGYCKRILVK